MENYVSDAGGLNSYQCQCPDGFTGRYCESEQQSCGGVFEADTGHIDFPLGDATTYSHGMECDWRITVSRGSVVNMTFTEFHVEGSGGRCMFDWLALYNREALVGKFCGTELPGEDGVLTHMPTGEPVRCEADWLERRRLALWCSGQRGR